MLSILWLHHLDKHLGAEALPQKTFSRGSSFRVSILFMNWKRIVIRDVEELSDRCRQ